jgi:hypothetical protein
MIALWLALNPWEPAPPPPPPSAFAAEEVREIYNAEGQKVRELVVVGERLLRESTFTYDAAGRPLRRLSQEAQSRTEETWLYDDKGLLLQNLVVVDGVVQKSVQNRYDAGRLVRSEQVGPAGTQIRTFTYGPRGELLSTEARGADGALLARTLAERPAPAPTPVPILLAASLGVSSASVTGQSDRSVGFSILRKPGEAQYRSDPLEVRVSSAWTRSEVGETVVNDQLLGSFGVDYNELVPRLTPFVFGAVERNPATNLDIDLTVAPAGLKLDLVPNGRPTLLDVSGAPVWGYRAVLSPEGTDCDGFTQEAEGACVLQSWRASLRLRGGYARATPAGDFKLLDVVEFLPQLGAAGENTIFKNTFTLTVPLAKFLSMGYSLAYVSDPLLASQIDCSADPGNLACDGQQITMGGQVTLSHRFTR